jgi:hypothetical protein
VVTNAGQLISGGGSDIKSESVAISARYLNLSTFRFPTRFVSRQNPPGAAGYLPNERRLILARPSQSSRRIERNKLNWQD